MPPSCVFFLHSLSATFVRDYLVNYARLLIYSTSLGGADVIVASCFFDLLEDKTGENVVTEHSRSTSAHLLRARLPR